MHPAPHQLSPQPNGTAHPAAPAGQTYPGIAEIIERLRHDTQLAPREAAAQQPAPVAQHPAAEAMSREVFTLEAVPSAATHEPSHAAAPQVRPAQPQAPVEPRPAEAQASAAVASELTEEELIAALPLRDLAREAVRARMLAVGQGTVQRRSAYEIVFILLAFGVTVLVTAPPLVQLVHALHGTPVK